MISVIAILWIWCSAERSDSSTIVCHEVEVASLCKSIPNEMVAMCNAHQGKSTPFIYATIDSRGKCGFLLDSTNRKECEDSLRVGSTYYASSGALSPTAETHLRKIKVPRRTPTASLLIGAIYGTFTIVSVVFIYSRIQSWGE